MTPRQRRRWRRLEMDRAAERLRTTDKDTAPPPDAPAQQPNKVATERADQQ
jgi:hypothetical protein